LNSLSSAAENVEPSSAGGVSPAAASVLPAPTVSSISAPVKLAVTTNDIVMAANKLNKINRLITTPLTLIKNLVPTTRIKMANTGCGVILIQRVLDFQSFSQKNVHYSLFFGKMRVR
jgi:hypothetical protein